MGKKERWIQHQSPYDWREKLLLSYAYKIKFTCTTDAFLATGRTHK